VAVVVLIAGCTSTSASAPRIARTSGSAAGSGYTFVARKLSPTIRKRVVGVSWHRGCPVALGGLRYLRIAYRGFDSRLHRGEMVANASAVGPLRRAFWFLFDRGFPIRRMRLVDDYGGSDYRSIEADNTSAFNCRPVTGGSRWSEHAYGRAVDVNPIENPYVANGHTSHPASRRFLDRSRHRRGMAFAGGALVRAFRRVGWGWGGTWSNPTDYQHFSATGR
jgi:D-alanyl-D-alanine carboxypeptidase